MRPIQLQLFQQNLVGFLNNIPNQLINYLEFFMILQQLSITFASSAEAQKYKRLFYNKKLIPKAQLLSMQLQSIEIRNNQPLYIINFPHDIYEKQHKPHKCFNFWIELMRERYGSQLRWFEEIALNKDVISLKLFTFKQRLIRQIKETRHSECVDNICLFFPKTKSNQIQWVTFMNVIRGAKNLYKNKIIRSVSSAAPKNLKYYASKSYGQKTQVNSRTYTQNCYSHKQNHKEPQYFKANQKEDQIRHIRSTFSNYDNPIDINLLQQNVKIIPNIKRSQRILKKHKNPNKNFVQRDQSFHQTLKNSLDFSNKRSWNIFIS